MPLAVLVDLARVSLVALINWIYLSQEVDLGNANDHEKSEGSDPPHRSIPRYNLITAHPVVGNRVHTIGDHLSLGVDPVVGTSSTLGWPDCRPRSPASREEKI